jgi:hypothetical protein
METIMNKNVGGIDRIGRIVIGALALVAGIAVVAGVWEIGIVVGAVALILGAILLVTGTTQQCPLNEMAGIDTTE